MDKIFVIKNDFTKESGQVIFSDKGFKVEFPSEKEQKDLQELFDEFSQEGIRMLGPIILDKPIKSDDPSFFKKIQYYLVIRGYSFVEKKK